MDKSSNKNEKYLNLTLLDDNMGKKGISRSIIQRFMVLALLEQLGKDINKCDNCKEKLEHKRGKRTILIHHIDNNPLNNKLSNLQILCNACHGLTSHFPNRAGKLNSNYKGLMAIAICKNCEKEFLHRNYHNTKKHFCCRACHRAYQKWFKFKTKCLNCGKEVTYSPSHIRKFCCLKCAYSYRIGRSSKNGYA